MTLWPASPTVNHATCSARLLGVSGCRPGRSRWPPWLRTDAAPQPPRRFGRRRCHLALYQGAGIDKRGAERMVLELKATRSSAWCRAPVVGSAGGHAVRMPVRGALAGLWLPEVAPAEATDEVLADELTAKKKKKSARTTPAPCCRLDRAARARV